MILMKRWSWQCISPRAELFRSTNCRISSASSQQKTQKWGLKTQRHKGHKDTKKAAFKQFLMAAFFVSLCPLCLCVLRRSDVEGSRAVAELVHPDTHLVEDRDEKVRHRRLVRIREVTPGFEPASKLSGQQAGQIEMAVEIAIPHAAAIQNQTVIQERAVAVFRSLQLRQEIAQ